MEGQVLATSALRGHRHWSGFALTPFRPGPSALPGVPWSGQLATRCLCQDSVGTRGPVIWTEVADLTSLILPARQTSCLDNRWIRFFCLCSLDRLTWLQVDAKALRRPVPQWSYFSNVHLQMANFPEEILALLSSCPSCIGKSYFLQEQRSCWGGRVWTGWSAFPLGTLSWVLKPSHKDVFWANLGVFISRTLSKERSLLVQICVVCGSVWILLYDIFPTFKFQAILSYIYFHG